MLAAGLVWVRTRRLYAQAAAVQDPASTSERPNAVSSPEGQQLILLAHQKLKSVADLQERIEWSCKNSCGFHAAFQQVCAHERTCDLKASASQKPMPHPCQFFGTAVDGVTLGDEERGGVSRSGEKVEEDRESGMVTGVGESTCDSMDSGVSPEINKISDALSQIRSQVIACVSRSLSLARSFSSHSLSLSLAFLSRLLALSRTLARSLRRGCALSLSFRPFPFSLRW